MEPIIGITMGDPAGVGPEIIIKSLLSEERGKSINPLVIGETTVLKKIAGHLKIDVKFRSFDNFESVVFEDNAIHVLEPYKGPLYYTWGKSNETCGDHSFNYVVEGTRLCMQNKIAALVTSPICKESWHLAGHKYDGHTGLLAKLTQTESYRMMFATDKLNVILVTTHLPLQEACSILSTESIVKTIELGYKELCSLKIKEPKIAVCGLNPHASENGLFGHEEKDTIIPAIEQARQKGIDVTGPYPSDTVFLQAINGHYDLVVALYHDQGLIPVKLLFFDTAVNMTVGLPIIRTSVDHGTAFDIAGKGIVNFRNLNCAINQAFKLTLSRNGF
ncbi:4-hydroxythreonine-4-phosphate dehydrogenase PdxA [bacterium]|nr:4-hydroxythreonine-4-phosphate dehydrogenase PdxA [bacterium]